MQRAYGDGLQLFLAGFHNEGRPTGGFKVEPRTKETEEALALCVHIRAGPPRCGFGMLTGECGFDALSEQSIAIGDGHGAQLGLAAHLGPEAMQNVMDDGAAVLRVKAERDTVERRGEEAPLGDGAECT